MSLYLLENLARRIKDHGVQASTKSARLQASRGSDAGTWSKMRSWRRGGRAELVRATVSPCLFHTLFVLFYLLLSNYRVLVSSFLLCNSLLLLS